LIPTLSSIYSAATTWRRQWFARNPSRVRHLTRPVVSVGNLRVGGTGKTPVVAHIAHLLADAGERPAILSRGYRRRRAVGGATIVSDGERVVGALESSGDEPLMLARAVPRARVVVGVDRYLCGRIAEEQLGATVHILDDGFQHLALARTVDLVLSSDDDLSDRPLPSGRLREPLSAARAADAALVSAGYLTAAERVARTLGIATAFRVARAIGAPRTLSGDSIVVPPESRVFLVAGIARPERFFSDVASAGWHVVGSIAFRDHHQFTARDVARISKAARTAAAAIVLTTDKDAVRLDSTLVGDLPIAAVPLVVDIEPADRFREWLLSRIR
jgi:tetraacyldisaccharide 4'-kinase